ncbi:hypothetical protein ABNQ38_34820 (plasmid) [Azospirillum sp. A29]|uniref:hypothetical protein n=1 Tax=Azospirillum sp. A29 TaxID=3160606 RepID=UPI0036727121
MRETEAEPGRRRRSRSQQDRPQRRRGRARRLPSLRVRRPAADDRACLRADLVVAPNLWAGVGLVRGGAGTALVGNPRQVADRLLEYRDLGVDSFILSGYPHLEEAHRVADLLFPPLPVTAPPPVTQPALDVAFVSPFGDLQPARSAS